ncbi:MAG: hypothetical protein V1781_04380 [Bacteroidota bacterium]
MGSPKNWFRHCGMTCIELAEISDPPAAGRSEMETISNLPVPNTADR